MKLTISTHLKLFITYSGIIMFATLLVAFFMLNPVSTDTSATTSFNVNHSATGYTLSLELVGTNPGTVALSADTSAGGTWVAGKQTVRATTNSPAGYQLFLSMDGATNSLTGSNDDTHTLPAGGGSLSSPATLALNRWGYAIPDQTGYDGAFSGDYTIASDSTISNSTTWATMPNVSAPVLVDTVTGQPAGATTTKDLNIYYGAAADIGLVSDTYLGTVLYSAISDTSDTGTESASINPSSQKLTDTNISVDITTPLYTTTDLTTSDVTATIGGATCPVTAVTRNPAGSSNPNAVVVTCTAPTSATTGKKDVVVSVSRFGKSYTITNGYEYVNHVPSDITELENLQQLAEYPEACTNTTEGVSADIPDARDGQVYKIFRAKDGNCWMGENLRYGATTGGAARAYTSADAAQSNNVNTTNMAKLTTSKICTTSSNCKNPNDSSTTAFDSYAINYTDPYIMIYQANTAATYDGKTKYGVLYNYCAATGGTACTASSTSYTVSGSVCPKGWTLPKVTGDPTGSGTSTGEKSYNDLFNGYSVTNDSAGFNIITQTPLSFVRSGYALNGSLNSRSSSGSGVYWSSTPYSSADYAYDLEFYSREVARYVNDRYNGYSVRCVSAS